MTRIDGRKQDELRPVEIIPNINKFAEGSCLIRCGNTHVLCTASVEDRPPRHVPEGEGWVTAEYSMLPRANRERSRRDISKLKLNGRSAEIQRLIGRALRSVVDMKKLGPWNITIDCDVLQGDGGTRTASITGGFVAMMLAFRKMMEAYLSAPFSGNERAVVSKVCRKLLNKIVRPSLAVPYVVALGKRNLLWDLLPDHIEEHVLEVDHAE